MRLVLDTNIVVSALLWGGLPRRVLDLGRNKVVTFFTSPVLLDELADVFSREKFVNLLARHQITPDYLMQRYSMLTTVISSSHISRTVPNDPDDDAVLACALAAQADMIVTGDSDLLSLHPFQNIQILNAADALKQIMAAMAPANASYFEKK